MRKILQLTTAISLAAGLALALPAMAQEHYGDHGDHHGGPGGHGPGGPGYHGPGGPGGHGPGGPGYHGPGGHGPGGFHHALGDRGYSFRGPGGHREIRLFSPREREIWGGGHWHHEMRFGRMGYWYEVNGAWYFYDQPFDGPPAYVSDEEFFDPDVEVVGPPAVVVAPPPAVVVVPPAVCIGPLCVR